MPIFPKVTAIKVKLHYRHFIGISYERCFIQVVYRLTVRSEFVIPSHPVCAGFVRKKCTGEPESERVMSYTRGVAQVRSCRFGCIVVSGPHPLRRCTAAVPGTKTPCRTITLNKSLHPIAIRRGSFAGCLYRCCCLNKIKTTAATVSSGRCQEFIARGDALLDY